MFLASKLTIANGSRFSLDDGTESTFMFFLEENSQLKLARYNPRKKEIFANHFDTINGNCILAIVWNFSVKTRNIVMSKSRAIVDSVSLRWRMQSTRFNSNLHDIVWMLVGSDSSWTFFENR